MGRNRLGTNLGHCDWTEGNQVKPQSYSVFTQTSLKHTSCLFNQLARCCWSYNLHNIQAIKENKWELSYIVHNKIYKLDLLEYFGWSEWNMK
jgi:hypothetical protein